MDPKNRSGAKIAPWLGKDMVREHDEKASIKDQDFLSDLAVDLAPEALRAYDAVVRPNAILPIPRYFTEEWLPLLGTSRAWLVLAFRQVAFVSRSSSEEVLVRTTLRKLGRWCGLTHVRIHQVLKDPGYLTWFVRSPQGVLSDRQYPRSQPTSYMVRSDIPLTPYDQARLSLWFEQRSPSDDKAWILALGEAIEAKKLTLPEDTPLPNESMTIQQLVYAQRGDDTPLPPGIDEACTELHARWIQPDLVTLVTHYFLVRWLPDLSPGLGWLIVLLRSRAYQQKDDLIGQVWVNGGWGSIANSLGVSRRSLTRWVSSPNAHLFFRQRSDVQDPTDRRNLLLAVRLSEPIHSIDQEVYQRKLDGQSLTSPLPADRQSLTSPALEDGHSLTTCGESSTDHGNFLTSNGQNFPIERHDLTRGETDLNKKGTELNNLKYSLNQPSKFINQAINQPLEDHAQSSSKEVVVPSERWQLDKIISSTGVGKRIQDAIMNASEQEKNAFMGWLLFALSVPSINYPVLFAHKRNLEGLPPGPFLRLAQIPPSKCYRWIIENDEDIPPYLKKAIEDLRRQRGHEKLLQLGAVHPKMDEWIVEAAFEGQQPKDDMSRKKYVPPIAIRSDGMTAEQAWQVARGQLQAEVDRVAFETWVRDVEYINFEDGMITLGVANEYARDWLEDRLTSIAERVLTGIIGQRVKVHFEMIYAEV
jgi:hypothetical protein